MITEKRKAFEAKRRGHYREWEAVQMARKKLLEEDEDEADDDDEPRNTDDETTNDEPEQSGSPKNTKCVSPCDSETQSQLNSPE